MNRNWAGILQSVDGVPRTRGDEPDWDAVPTVVT